MFDLLEPDVEGLEPEKLLLLDGGCLHLCPDLHGY
jgi:hypothetical protein